MQRPLSNDTLYVTPPPPLPLQGAPSFVRLYAYPHLEPGAIVAAKSFDRADSVKFNWNKQGTALVAYWLIWVRNNGSYNFDAVNNSSRVPFVFLTISI